MEYQADADRYGSMNYHRCGRSGLLLPEISLGLWHNFGGIDSYKIAREVIFTAFDRGVTYFDLANNYGPPPGSAESNFGVILNQDLKHYRDQMIISTKAGYPMWEGPYGDWGSRKYLISSLDQSLKRMGLDYVDIFYHHRPDPQTPLEESMAALDHIVRSGRALYVGLSNYSAEQFAQANAILKRLGTPCVVEQSRYSMLRREPEDQLLAEVKSEGAGFVAFSPLAQGLLTDRYLKGIPHESRARRGVFLKEGDITPERISMVEALSSVAESLSMTMAQLAVKWLLRSSEQLVTSVLIGASSPRQVTDIVDSVERPQLSEESISLIEEILRLNR